MCAACEPAGGFRRLGACSVGGRLCVFGAAVFCAEACLNGQDVAAIERARSGGLVADNAML